MGYGDAERADKRTQWRQGGAQRRRGSQGGAGGGSGAQGRQGGLTRLSNGAEAARGGGGGKQGGGGGREPVWALSGCFGAVSLDILINQMVRHNKLPTSNVNTQISLCFKRDKVAE